MINPGSEAHHHHARIDDLFPYVSPPASRPPAAQHTSFSSSAVPSPSLLSSRARKFWRTCPASTVGTLVRTMSSPSSHFFREISTERTTPLEQLETSTAPAARSTRASRRPSPRRRHRLASPCASSPWTGGMLSQKRICGADSCRGAWLCVARGAAAAWRRSVRAAAALNGSRPRVGGCLTAPMQRCSESAFVAGHGWRRCAVRVVRLLGDLHWARFGARR